MRKHTFFQQFESPFFAAEDVTFCKSISDSLMVEYLAVSQVVVVRFHVAESIIPFLEIGNPWVQANPVHVAGGFFGPFFFTHLWK